MTTTPAPAPLVENNQKAPEQTMTTRPKLSVIGTGYLGATHAVCMAHLGYEVIGLDVDEAKVAALAAGEVPFFEPGLTELLRKALESGRLRFTTSWQEVGQFADVHFVCVGTPQLPGGTAADLRHVEGAFTALAPWLRPGALVVGKSTVPVGTAARMADLVAALCAGIDVEVAWNPEFLREGFAIDDTLRPDRLVIGVRSTEAEAVLRQVYAPILNEGCPIVVTDFATAELVKTAANSFLATKISFINAMAEICEAAGGDVLALSNALGLDPRIGNRFLHPGLGFGGGCLPKDIRAFQARAQELGVGEALAFLDDVDAVNLRTRERVVRLCVEALGGDVAGRRICALGAAFKPDSDDVRDSPALDVADQLRALGAHVRVFDPAATANAARIRPELTYTNSIWGAAVDAELVVVLTEWNEFRQLSPDLLAEMVDSRQIVDSRNCLDPAEWSDRGWTYRAPGRAVTRSS
jgi:UDPglucose 6-dehydrogenase